ncbi:phenylacetate--CoA ligase family protein [Massilia forsythiae]|uniref:Phenylacetate--CoA ligase family protein n=2 Tax=Massilia forsythiae TaxID=2728020 RepID=A0A7Z2ZV88_9BURK|nr:phenylacetate--CoA ligase family protein [Massilia forsythiae]
MAAWGYALKHSLRSLARELLRNVWGRVFVYPRLAANERSAAALYAYRRRRAAAIGVALGGDGTRLAHLAPPAPGLLAKQEVRDHPQRLVRPRGPGSWLRTTIRTSGTSGSPLRIVQSIGTMVREEGFIYRQLRWIGWRHGQRRAWIRGDIVCPERPRDRRYWCRDWVGNLLMMSSYHLSNDTIGAYIDALERFDPVVIHAYPSSIAALAAWLEAAGRRYQGAALRGVMTSSETLEPAVRAAVERGFGVRVFDWYGQAERVAAIGTCEHGRYHVLTDYSDVALLGAGEGEADACELVGTTLNNAAMALVRYRTGDSVVPDHGAAPCPCGRVFPTVAAVLGRRERIVTLPDGRLVARLDRIFQGHERRLLEGQVVYRGNAEFVLRVVVADGFGEGDARALVDKFLLRVPGVEVSVERVDAIARGPNGKFEFVAIATGP